MGTVQEIDDVPEYLRSSNQCDTPVNLQLFEAAYNGDVEELKQALSKGANPNYFSKSNDGTLHAASRNASSQCAKELIDHGACVSAAVISNRNTPIHEASMSGSKEVVEVLLQSFPECTSFENSYGNCALHAAARACFPEIVRILLANSADPNQMNHRGSTALHVVCVLAPKEAGSDDSHVKIAAMLLCHEKIMVDIQDINGYTALHHAAQSGCDEIVKMLIDSGASLTVKTGIDAKGRGGRTPESCAKFGGWNDTAEMIKGLSNLGEDAVTKKLARELLAKS